MRLATFCLLSLAVGVTIVSLKGTNIDLLHVLFGNVLFGNVLALDNQTLLLIAVNATISLLALAVIYRPLVLECVDPGFMRACFRSCSAASAVSFVSAFPDATSRLEVRFARNEERSTMATQRYWIAAAAGAALATNVMAPSLTAAPMR